MLMNGVKLFTRNASLAIPTRLLTPFQLSYATMDTHQPDREVVEFMNKLMDERCRVKASINQQIMASRNARTNRTIVRKHGHGKDPLAWPWLRPPFVVGVEHKRIFL